MARSGGDMTASEQADAELGDEVRSRVMATRLDEACRSEDGRAQPCPKCGHLCRVKGSKRARELLTLSGVHVLRRNYHYCASCRHGWYPLDASLGLPASGKVSREVERRLLDFGLHDTFENAAERWSVHYNRPVSENLVRNVVERVGERLEECNAEQLQCELHPPSPEPAQVLVVGVDGSMLPTRGKDPWREAKVAAVYRTEKTTRFANGERRQLRDARFLAVLGGKEALAHELRAALAVERAHDASQGVWIGDGAPWIWKLAEELMPEAHQVLDWYHLSHHVHLCRKVLFGNDGITGDLWQRRAEDLVWHGEIDLLLHELETCLPECKPGIGHTSAIHDLIRYIETHEERLNYAVFREAGFPTGSGFIESAQRHVLQARMKRAGQHWDPTRANRMSRLRAALRTAGPKHVHQAIYDAMNKKAA
ncbi:MAG: ISKra4 family transposase [Gammaproteobacteria bacterium]|nr:ISKra4 family transposase [Gammaproteobacteria bacterium]